MLIRSHILRFVILLCGIFILQACSEESDQNQPATNNPATSFNPTPYLLATGNFIPPMLPPDNPLTVEGVKLGRMLFYEKKLSKDGSMSCASCHRQEHAFTDTSRFSVGIRGKFGTRQAMSVFNMAWNTNEFFWDGRARLLRDQSLHPIQDSLEMDEELDSVIAKLEASQMYRDQFKKAFGSTSISAERMGLAMEQFMNSIVSVRSKYDLAKDSLIILDSSEERGRILFFNEFNPAFPALSGADCQHCHSGINFENNRYLNNGLDTDADMTDMGRMRTTGQARDKGKFKVTSLRNIAITPPYMHDGRFKTLEEVIDHYNTGLKNSSTLDPTLLFPLNSGGLMLSNQDKQDLIAFLNTLTDYDLITNPEYSDPF